MDFYECMFYIMSLLLKDFLNVIIYTDVVFEIGWVLTLK